METPENTTKLTKEQVQGAAAIGANVLTDPELRIALKDATGVSIAAMLLRSLAEGNVVLASPAEQEGDLKPDSTEGNQSKDNSD